jgi:Carboxypeptidase regulatory-like domain
VMARLWTTEILDVLKGHGFSRAEDESRRFAALATEGTQVIEDALPQGLKPKIQFASLEAPFDYAQGRLSKSYPFKKTESAGRPSFSAIFFVLAMLLALPGLTQSAPQSPDPHKSPGSNLYRIAGTVVNSASGEPLRHATVAALSEEDSHTVASAESDSEGRFALLNLPAAKYQLTASKRGYRTAFYDEHDEYSTAIVTGPDQDTGSLTFRLVPGGVLHGVVLTDGGDPVADARVMLFLKSHPGKPGPRIDQADAATTDDTGSYEFNDLAAGEYLLAVVAEPWYAIHRSAKDGNRTRRKSVSIDGAPDPAAALDVAYPVTYYDSTTDEALATHIAVTGGSRQEADINLHAVPALHIEVDTPRKPDGSIARAELRQTVFGAVVSAESAGFLDAMQSGTTEFSGVAPGHYELAQGDPPRVVEMDATASVKVDPSLGTATASIHGALRTAAGAPLTDDCNLTLEPVEGTERQSSIQTNCIRGAFSFPNVAPGEWQLSGETSGRLLPIAAITAGGRTHAGNLITVQDRPLTLAVTVTQAATRLQGFARRDGKGVSGVMVLLVPAGMAAIEGLARRDQSDSDGSFSLRDVVPGNYIAVAIEDGWDLDWTRPQVIGRYLPGGIPVTVTDKEGKLTKLNTPVPVQTR